MKHRLSEAQLPVRRLSIKQDTWTWAGSQPSGQTETRGEGKAPGLYLGDGFKAKPGSMVPKDKWEARNGHVRLSRPACSH